jgi:hypothetical protein
MQAARSASFGDAAAGHQYGEIDRDLPAPKLARQ